MKKVLCFLTLLGTLLPITLFSQISLQNWSNEYHIVFEDFKAEAPNMINDGNQMFHLHLVFDVSQINTSPVVRLYFDKDKSWIEQGDQTDALIEISNMQFDLAELYLRRIKDLLRNSKSVLQIDKENIISKELRSFYDDKVRMVSDIIISNFDHSIIHQYQNWLKKELSSNLRP